MAELIAILELLLKVFSVSPATLARLKHMMAQGAVNLAMLAVCYLGFYVLQEKSLSAGFRAAFMSDARSQIERERIITATQQQAELRQAAVSEVLIQQLLGAVLERSPGAARVRLGVIHNGIFGISGLNMLRFDIVNSRAIEGRSAGMLATNESLAGWSTFLATLIRGDCAFKGVDELDGSTGTQRAKQMGVVRIMICPVVDVRGQMLGAIFTQWDRADLVPPDRDLPAIQGEVRGIGRQIASALDLKAGTTGLADTFSPRSPVMNQSEERGKDTMVGPLQAAPRTH